MRRQADGVLFTEFSGLAVQIGNCKRSRKSEHTESTAALGVEVTSNVNPMGLGTH